MVSCWSSVCLSIRLLVRLSFVPPSKFSFPDYNLSKWIFTKLGMCIDIVEIWLGIANEQILVNFWQLSARDGIMAGYHSFMFLFKFVIVGTSV